MANGLDKMVMNEGPRLIMGPSKYTDLVWTIYVSPSKSRFSFLIKKKKLAIIMGMWKLHMVIHNIFFYFIILFMYHKLIILVDMIYFPNQRIQMIC